MRRSDDQKVSRMRTTQQFSITLPHDMAEAVEDKIKSGGYASVSEVLRDGVRALMERDAAVQRWLREEIVAGHRDHLADPSNGVSGDEILARVGAKHARRDDRRDQYLISEQRQ